MGEGRKRHIRESCKQLGLLVVRIRIGTLRLGTLNPRQWRSLTTKDAETFNKQ